MVFPEVGVGMTRRLAISTTSLPLNFFSSSRTSRCCTLWKALSSLYGTCSAHDNTQLDATQGHHHCLPVGFICMYLQLAHRPLLHLVRGLEQPVRHLEGQTLSSQYMMHGAHLVCP